MQGPATDVGPDISPAGADASVMDVGPNEAALGQHSTDAKDIVQSQGVMPSLIFDCHHRLLCRICQQ